jgi:hypothetical protein
MATDIMEFFPNVAAAVDLCPSAVIRQTIIEAIRKFCEETNMWVERLQAQSVVASTAEYDLTADTILLYDGSTQLNTVADIDLVQHVELSNIDLEPTSQRYLDENERGWRQHSESRPRRFLMEADRQLRLVYTPSQAVSSGLDIWVCLKPIRPTSISATITVEDFLFDDFRLMIEWGTLALLKEVPLVPWSDPEAATFYWGKWNTEMENAYEKKREGYTDHQGSVYFRPDYDEV